MKELKYYYDEEHDVLSVYNRETEFFAQFSPAKNEWVKSEISFSQFKHDYYYRAVTESEAMKMTGGVSAGDAFESYAEIIKANRGEI